MVSSDRRHLLFIEPRGAAAAQPVLDTLTRVVVGILRSHTRTGTRYMGWHTCVCGMRSDTADLVIGRGGLTHSLAAHYLAFHRGEVPAAEMAKVRALVAAWLERHPGLAATIPTSEELGTVEHRVPPEQNDFRPSQEMRFSPGALYELPGILQQAWRRWTS